MRLVTNKRLAWLAENLKRELYDEVFTEVYTAGYEDGREDARITPMYQPPRPQLEGESE